MFFLNSLTGISRDASAADGQRAELACAGHTLTSQVVPVHVSSRFVGPLTTRNAVVCAAPSPPLQPSRTRIEIHRHTQHQKGVREDRDKQQYYNKTATRSRTREDDEEEEEGRGGGGGGGGGGEEEE